MDLGFTEETTGPTPVLELRGDADLSTLPLLHDRVYRFAGEQRGRHVVIDLDGLGSLDPVVLGVLIGARLQLRVGGGDLDLVCTSPALVALFEATGLDATFPLHATVAAAIRARRP
jgi:anti-sigma B factor antagonist